MALTKNLVLTASSFWMGTKFEKVMCERLR